MSEGAQERLNVSAPSLHELDRRAARENQLSPVVPTPDELVPAGRQPRGELGEIGLAQGSDALHLHVRPHLHGRCRRRRARSESPHRALASLPRSLRGPEQSRSRSRTPCPRDRSAGVAPPGKMPIRALAPPLPLARETLTTTSAAMTASLVGARMRARVRSDCSKTAQGGMASRIDREKLRAANSKE